MKYNTEKAANIINNNYTVQRTWDDMPDGFVGGRMLSKKEALVKLNTMTRSRLTYYKVVEHLSIVGIVPFNKGEAYVFNKKPPVYRGMNGEVITCDTYESLMSCYVFHSEIIDPDLLKRLKNEYYERGGYDYPKYHAFEDMELSKVRQQRKREYRNEIVFGSIFKHGFREVGKNKWSYGVITVKQKLYQRSSIHYPYVKSHTELHVGREKMMYIGSIFGAYLTSVNQLSKNVFGIPCGRSTSAPYNFVYFEIDFKQ